MNKGSNIFNIGVNKLKGCRIMFGE
jgi:hypothetical protein